jgi:hypothetical protein
LWDGLARGDGGHPRVTHQALDGASPMRSALRANASYREKALYKRTLIRGMKVDMQFQTKEFAAGETFRIQNICSAIRLYSILIGFMIGTLSGQNSNPVEAKNFFAEKTGDIAFVERGSAGPCLPDSHKEVLSADSILRVDLEKNPKWHKLPPGSRLEGTIPHPVYSGGRLIIPESSRLVLEVDEVQKKRLRKVPFSSWEVKVLTLLHIPIRKYDTYSATFRSASILFPSGEQVPLQLSCLRIEKRIKTHSKGKTHPQPPQADFQSNQADRSSHRASTTLVVSLLEPAEFPTNGLNPAMSSPAATVDSLRIPPGTVARLLLLTDISASQNKKGDQFQARLMEPIGIGERLILPEGCLFEGQINHRTPPRYLGRSGSLHLVFENIIFPTGETVKISASLNSAESVGTSSLLLDSEGELHAAKQGKAMVALQIGTSYLMGKLADDLLEEGIKLGAEEIASTTVATAARYVGIGTGVALFVLHKGKDVCLPKYGELTASFDRPLVLSTGNFPTEP